MLERQVTLPDVDLVLAESGQGGHPLLLLHGFTGAKEDFTEWLDRLADLGWHAVAPDLRGHGASAKPLSESAYSFDLLAGDALNLADALDWTTFSLLGHSMGGMAAQIAAIRSPSRLSALVLMDTSHGPIQGLDASLVEASLALVRDQGLGALADLLSSADASPLETPAHRRVMEQRPGYREFMEGKLRSTSPAAFCALAPAFGSCPDRLDDLRSLSSRFPSMVIVGEQDAPFLGPSTAMAKALNSGPAVVIADAGHSPQFENPAQWWEVLSHFLKSVPSR